MNDDDVMLEVSIRLHRNGYVSYKTEAHDDCVKAAQYTLVLGMMQISAAAITDAYVSREEK